MPTVDNHIASLLQEHDCVIIPGFGGLITQYSSVRIHPVRHSMAPPSKKVAFNEKLQLSDGRLVNHISLQEHLSEADATTRVQAFVATVNLALEQHRRYQLQEIGLFRKEPGQGIEFEYEEKVNLLAESFGLPEVFSKPVLRGRSLAEIKTAVQEKVALPLQAEKPGKTQNSAWKKAFRYAAILPILMLSASAVYLATNIDNGFSLSNLNPVSLLFHKTEKDSGSGFSNEEDKEITSIGILSDLERAAYYQTLSPAKTETKTYLTDQFLSQEIRVEPEITEPIKPEVSELPSSKPADPVLKAVKAEKNVAKKEDAAKSEISETNPATIETKTGRFYIIAGGFLNRENAIKLQKKIKADGKDARIILPGKESRLNRVTVGEFETKQEAISNLPDLTSAYGKALWVLEY